MAVIDDFRDKKKTSLAKRQKRLFNDGAPEWIRTIGTQFRKLLLYPPELRARTKPLYQIP